MDENLEIWSAEMLGVIASEDEFPALNDFKEFDGMAIKTYPFLNGHSKIKTNELPEIKREQDGQSPLHERKDELEKKIELRYKKCRNLFNNINTNMSMWMPRELGDVFLLDEENTEKVLWFAKSINAMLNGIIPNGAERDRILKDLKENEMCCGQISFKKEFNESIFEDIKRHNWRLLQMLETDTDEETVVDMQELLQFIGKLLDKIESVISESVDLYYEYISIHSQLYNMDGKAFINSLRPPKSNAVS